MWMRILEAAGLPFVGERFPGDWEQTLRQANPHGFYESLLRHGVYHRTNPHPATGEYVRPDDVREHAVKIFIPGLIRSEASYLDRVIVTVRPWREYEASVTRMVSLEDEALADDPEARRALAALRMPPALEWWDEHFALVRDISVRGYACHVQSYDGVLEDPRGVVEHTLRWLEVDRPLDLEAAVAVVDPACRRFEGPRSEAVEPEVAEVFDAFYAAVRAGEGLSGELISRMNATHERLAPRIAEHRERIAMARGLRPRPEPGPEGPFAVLPGEWA